ncbi:MAG: OmpA family protein [Deltaproteobacteria bacterium]|nr:OmpA family protein [Deltaproteobacteria bacterium]
MIKKLIKAMTLAVMGALVIGCGGQEIIKTETFSPYEFEADRFEPKVDNFLVILDASSSMSEVDNGKINFQTAKNFVNAMNQTIPDLNIKGALRTFGHHGSVSGKKTTLLYGVTEYSEKDFDSGLGSVTKPGGTSRLAMAIDAGMIDLAQSQGEIAVIIVSDGKNMAGTTLQSAREMKNKFGDRLCTYTVLVGNSRTGESILKQIAELTDCGFPAQADSLTSSDSMANFVKKIFLVKASDSDGDGVLDKFDQCPDTPKGVVVDANGCPLDSDGDGVTDDNDECPGTPSGVKVDDRGCPLDSDGDGVTDDNDECPNTPKGATVDERGCWAYSAVLLFDFDSSVIQSDAYPMLDEAASVMKKNPEIRVEIQGHTDGVGSAEYNMKLSEKRAEAVMNYFVEQNVQAERLTVTGYGLTRPAYPNDTPMNQAKNRRVELKPIR